MPFGWQPAKPCGDALSDRIDIRVARRARRNRITDSMKPYFINVPEKIRNLYSARTTMSARAGDRKRLPGANSGDGGTGVNRF